MRWLAAALLIASPLARADPGAERFSAGLIVGKGGAYGGPGATLGVGVEAHVRLEHVESVPATISVGGRAIVVPSPDHWERAEHFDAHIAVRKFFYRDRCSSFFADAHLGYALVTLHDSVYPFVNPPDDDAHGIDFGLRFGGMVAIANGWSLGGVGGLSIALLEYEVRDDSDGLWDLWAYAAFLVGFGG